MVHLFSEKELEAQKDEAVPDNEEPSATSDSIPQVFPDFHRRIRLTSRWILGADLSALVLSYLGGVLFVLARFYVIEGGFPDNLFNLITAQSFIVFWAVALFVLLWLEGRGHYRQRLPYWETVGHILGAATVGFISCGFIEFVSRNNGSRVWTAFCWAGFALLSLVNRALVRRYLGKKGQWKIPAIVIGEGATAKAAVRALKGDGHFGFLVLEQFPSSILATMKKTLAWKQILALHDAQYVFLALEGSDLERYHAALKYLPRARVPCSIVPPWLGLPSDTMTPHHFVMQDVMIMHDTNRLKLPLPRVTKRIVDIVLSSMALFALSPVFLLAALAVRSDGGPALFIQPRIGRGGRLFPCYKFRSMRMDAEAYLDRYLAEHPEAAEEWKQFQKLKEDVRITRVGKFIRKFSIDELPQLINVLKGDMSLVGPRPCMTGQESFYAEDFSFYQAVRPGITGPWQVSGRNQLTFKERVDLEAWYARNWSLWLDIVIMLKTVPTLLRRGQAF